MTFYHLQEISLLAVSIVSILLFLFKPLFLHLPLECINFLARLQSKNLAYENKTERAGKRQEGKINQKGKEQKLSNRETFKILKDVFS